MADNFNLRAFLTENKLTKNSQLLKEQEEDYKYFDEEGIGGFYLGQVKGITIYSLEDSSVMDTCMYALEGPQGVEFIDIDVAGEPISSEELQNEYELQSDIADFIAADIDRELGEELDETFVPKSDAEYKRELEDYLEDNQIYGYTDRLFDILTDPAEETVADKLADFLDDNQIYGYNKGLLAIFRDYSNRNYPDNEDNLDEARYSDSYDSPASKEVHAQLSSISLQDLDAAIAKAEEETGTKVSDLERRVLTNQKHWMNTMAREMERESVKNKKPVMEANLTDRERRLVEMVNRALKEEENVDYTMGSKDKNQLPNPPAQLNIKEKEEENVDYTMGSKDKNQLPNPPAQLNIKEDEMVDKKPLPEYNNIEELMKNIEESTNRVAEEHKIAEMKKIAEALRMEAKKMEESEHAKHINPGVLKKYITDAGKIEKAAEKLRVALEKQDKKNKPAAAPKAEKVEALQEGTFDLRKFLAENRK
jgi:hypothetical protein